MQADSRPTYGSVSGSYALDDNGSTVDITEHYVKGLTNRHVNKKYKIRHKVKDADEERQVYDTFSRKLQKDKGMLDPSFQIEVKRLAPSDGSYYVVESYTRIEPLMPDSPMGAVIRAEKERL